MNRIVYKLVITLSILLFGGAQLAAQCWKLVYPQFPKETINELYFTNAGNGFMALKAGIIGRTTDGGMNWVPINTPSYNNLYAIGAADQNNVWCGGDNGTLLHATDGGFQWQPVALNSTVSIRSVSFPSAQVGYLAGDSLVFKTVNGGQSWTSQSLAGGIAFMKIIKMEFFSTDIGYAYSSGKLQKTVNGGQTWSAIPTINFYQIDFATEAVGYAVGRSGNDDIYFKTTNGGTSWDTVYTILNYNPNISDMHVLSTESVYILNNGSFGGGCSINASINGGQTWQNTYIPELPWGSAIFYTSNLVGHAGDIWGNFRKIDVLNGGWITPANNTSGMKVVFALDVMNIWTMDGYVLKRSTNGGQTWTSNSCNIDASKLQFLNSSIGYARSGNLYKTTNGGQQWTQVSSMGVIKEFDFITPDFGMVVLQNGGMAVTHNGGQTWTQPSGMGNYYLTKVLHADSLHWFTHTALNGQFFKTSDGGVTWTALSYVDSGINDFSVLDSNTIHYIRGQQAYRSSDGGQTFQLWAGPPNTSPAWMLKMNSAKPDKTFIYNNMNYVSQDFPNVPRLWEIHNGVLQASPLHSSFPINDICFQDSTHAWLTTLFSSLYRYYPEGDCPPELMAPMLSKHIIKACAGLGVSIKVANYHSYNIPADTLRAELRSGTTILWSGVPDTSGLISFTVPATLGNYTLSVSASNPDVPAGIRTAITVTSLNMSNPQFSFWHSSCHQSACCASYEYSIGGGGTNLGTGHSYELHKLAKDHSTDSIVSIDQSVTTFSNVSDTFYAYYKVHLGEGICYPDSVIYSDTVVFNIKQPTLPVVNLSASSTAICANTGLQLTATSPNAGDYGRYYQFYQINSGLSQLIYSGPDSILNVPPVSQTTSFYCRMFPGWNGCNIMDTVYSDTVAVSLVTTPVVALTDNIGPGGICQGKAVTFFLDTAVVPGYNGWSFWKMVNGVATQLYSGYQATHVYLDANAGESYFFKLNSSVACAYYSDTLLLDINPPQQASIVLKPNGDLEAIPANALQYNWYYNNISTPIVTTQNILTHPSYGTYTLKVITGDSCLWYPSDPFVLQPASLPLLEQKAWEITPNPTKGQLTIFKEGYKSALNVVVTDLTGHRKKEMNYTASDQFLINIEDLVSGTYILKITESNGLQSVFRVIKL